MSACLHSFRLSFSLGKKDEQMEVPNGGIILHQALADNANFNYTVASHILHALVDPEPLEHPIGGKPFVHHLMNMYWRANNKEQKIQLAELLLISISKGRRFVDYFHGCS